MSYSTDGIRNIALAGQASAGKTTLFEALLHAGGAIQTAGSVEKGTTVSDSDPMEKERKHSMAASIASIDIGDVHVNLIDTPGFPDFRGPTLSALAAVETMAGLVAVGRAETGSGADYYLGKSGAELDDFESCYRFEVSGVDRGGVSEIRSRLRTKISQVTAAASNVPAIASVVGLATKVVVLEDVNPYELG